VLPGEEDPGESPFAGRDGYACNSRLSCAGAGEGFSRGGKSELRAEAEGHFCFGQRKDGEIEEVEVAKSGGGSTFAVRHGGDGQRVTDDLRQAEDFVRENSTEEK
jgi:hypothetical protein